MILEIPPITRIMVTLSVLLSSIVYFEIADPYIFYFNLKLIAMKLQVIKISKHI